MFAYLIYNKVDVERNKSYINWVIEECKELDIDMKLYTSCSDFKKLALPDFVINRSRSYVVSEYFESKSIRVFNNSQITKLTNDKLKTYDFYSEKTRMLETYMLKDKPHFYPCVLKSVDGHGGTEVYLLETDDEYKYINIEQNKDYLYQKLAKKGKDLRVFIIGKEIIASVLRTNESSFKSNYSLGGCISLYDLNNTERKIIESVLNELDFDYVGIDFLFNDNNNLILNEIEDAVGSRMLSELTDINIVNIYIRHILSKLNQD